eukprot:CAMPEP_0170066194 /NCGR_PEP_ID=MMETSP0019_2-20121128/5979_1 /TAXON_ID=98059 /ORGANISM="Dinobryon sp., Strain UTEXLB2267" /LENGTH=395 /DNA_ID=CAMNT_0010273215 /DNA_START=136 /DNA_END=1324 /DNA_ORIENTATION=-
MLAVVMRHEWVAMELIQCGADATLILPKVQRSALYVAVELDRSSIIKTVCEQESRHGGQLDVNQPVNQWVDPTTSRLFTRNMLHTALEYKAFGVMSLLLSLGADVNHVNFYGNTPLIVALIFKNSAAALMLLDAGARVDIPSTDSKRFPLYVAVEKGLPLVVEAILLRPKVYQDINASVLLPFSCGENPLHTAITYKQHDILQLLIKLGEQMAIGRVPRAQIPRPTVLDINARVTETRYTALMAAVLLNDEYSVRLLLQQDPDPLLYSNKGMNVLYFAAERGCTAILSLLLDYYGSGDRIKPDQPRSGRYRMDVNSVVSCDMVVPQPGNSTMKVKCFTALHVSAMFDRPHAIRHMVLHYGADLTRVDHQDKTPLQRAQEFSSFDAEKVIRQLLAE